MTAANYVGGSGGSASPAGAGPALGDRYRLAQRIGGGAAGETYAAVDAADGGACVVKVFHPGAAPAGAVAEFRRLRALSHPSIVRVRDVGLTADGRLFLVMDRVAGAPASAIAALEDTGARRAAFHRVACGLADALAYLHGRAIVHADISPANIRLADDGRPVLFDFGLAISAQPAGTGLPEGEGARGTLGYAAPEALIGRCAPASDLFALGATLFQVWSGAPPFGTGLEAVRRMLSSRAPLLSSVRDGLAPAWDELLARLLDPRPERRPASARELLREVTRLADGGDAPAELELRAPHPGGDPLAGIAVGRDVEHHELRQAIEQLAEGAVPCSVVAVAGAAGSGRRTVIELAVRDATIARAASLVPPFLLWRAPDLQRLVAAVQAGPAAARWPAGGEATRQVDGQFAWLADALERQAQERPLCVVLEADDAQAVSFAGFLAGAEPSGRLLLVLPARSAIERRFARTLSLGPLEPAAIEQLVARAAGESAPPEALAALARASGGHAAMVAALARRLVQALRDGDADRFRDEIEHRRPSDLRQLLVTGFSQLDPASRRLVGAAVLFGGDPSAAGLDPDAATRAQEQARRAGWWGAGPEGTAGVCASPLARDVVLAALGDPDLREVVQRAAATLPASDINRASALAALGDALGAARALRDAARGAEPVAAVPLLERAAALAPSVLNLDDHVTLVTGQGILGRYDDALDVLARVSPGAGEVATLSTLAERRAWLLGRRGDVAGARGVLEQALRAVAAGGAGEADGLLRARLARLLVTLGQLPQALEAAAPVLARGADDPNHSAAAEAAILAHAYGGDDGAARALHQSLAAGPTAEPGRAAYLGALIDQLAGRLQAAVPQYRGALDLCAASHDVHTLAAVALNLGALLADQGLYGEALTALARAIRELGRLGATAELGTALLNASNLFVVLGELGSARRLLGRARDEAATRGAPGVEAFARFVEADLEHRRGQPRAAAGLYQSAALALRQHGQPAAALSALCAAVEALCQAGQLADAARAFAALADTPAGAEPTSEAPERERAAARLILAGAPMVPGPPPEENSTRAPLAVAQRLSRLAALAAAEGRRPTAWRSAVCAARLFQRISETTAAREQLTRARQLFQEIQMATPELYRAGLTSDPDAAWLTGETPAAGNAAAAVRAAFTENRLRRLLRINKRLNSEPRLPRLLETIIDTVIELTDAERGFILLEDESGELAVRVARNIDQRTLETPELALSRSIARQAAAGGEPIVTIDAAGDDRFKEAVSVSDLHLRSVLAVPLVIKGRSAGTIYVDHRLRKGAFDQDDVNLVLDFAEQAAIALENARLLTQLRRRERQVEALNRRLEIELSARREEMTGMKQELLQNREALAIRYDYRNIVGRTPRMLDLFRLLDRITDTTLPVVVQGESGTGKELVARALHFNGPRRDRAFVSESCAAIPETLLESTLFGYVRGAFTGADHDTRGLFEIADGGTLFLDEIGEMSPAMQGKLLRVLQEGEFRRVGGERTRKVDVRIVAATNRDLARMVEEGKFRQDLYFRLSVARIFLPPLRERREDIPLIVEHLLGKHGGGAARKPIDPAVLSSLVAYRWPGNVRELENEIMRAVALSGERITRADLSPAVAAQGDGTAAAPDDPDSLRLRPRVERLERSLLREALGRFDNNQTKAADALGLSRFGLQKKLKRYRFA